MCDFLSADIDREGNVHAFPELVHHHEIAEAAGLRLPRHEMLAQMVAMRIIPPGRCVMHRPRNAGATAASHAAIRARQMREAPSRREWFRFELGPDRWDAGGEAPTRYAKVPWLDEDGGYGRVPPLPIPEATFEAGDRLARELAEADGPVPTLHWLTVCRSGERVIADPETRVVVVMHDARVLIRQHLAGLFAMDSAHVFLDVPEDERVRDYGEGSMYGLGSRRRPNGPWSLGVRRDTGASVVRRSRGLSDLGPCDRARSVPDWVARLAGDDAVAEPLPGGAARVLFVGGGADGKHFIVFEDDGRLPLVMKCFAPDPRMMAVVERMSSEIEVETYLLAEREREGDTVYMLERDASSLARNVRPDGALVVRDTAIYRDGFLAPRWSTSKVPSP